jgi:ATP-dependent helicase HrpB
MMRQLANTAAAAAAEDGGEALQSTIESSVDEDEAEEAEDGGKKTTSTTDSSSSRTGGDTKRSSTPGASEGREPRQQQQPQLAQLQEAWQEQAKKMGLIGALVALAYPDRIAQRKASGSSSSSSRAQFQLSGGATTKLWDSRDPLAEAEYIAIAELSQGKGGDNDVIRLGAALTRRAIQTYLQQEIQVRATRGDKGKKCGTQHHRP